jgi:glycosyltransferase involved in cell wall biosynthesis
MKRIIVLGKLFEKNKINGPGNVINHLKLEFERKNINVEYIFIDENNSILKVLLKITKNIIFSVDNSVNIHTDGYILGMIVYLVSRINKKNEYYLTVHGIYKIESKIAHMTKRKYLILEKFLYRNFDNLICVSNKLKNDISTIYGRKHNIWVINNGVDYVELGNGNIYFNAEKIKKIDFIFVGGINRRKGIIQVLRTLNYIVNNSFLDVTLNIYGSIEDDDIYSKYKQYITTNGLERKIKYNGLEKNKKVLLECYKKSTFNLCLSLYDTFNVAVLESMSVGCPCIISNNCGAKDIISDKKDGFIVSLDESYESNILKILNDIYAEDIKIEDIKNNAKKVARKNTWANVADGYAKLLHCCD